MASMREHLRDFHEREAQHHDFKSKHHAAVSGHYQKLASTLGKTEVNEAQKDSAGILEALATLHEKLSGEHGDMAAHHQDQAEACSKAVDATGLNKLVPTSVSAIAPERPKITPVLRPGQREIPTGVQPDLAKLLGNDPESWHTEETSLH